MKFQNKSQQILDKAMGYIQSVPYQVSARWLFYRLLQDGTYSAKDDYDKFLWLIARARKDFSGAWRPYTLTDETRRPIYTHGAYETPNEWFSAMANNQCSLNEWFTQPYYVEIWFEAQAMERQFQHYTEHVTLRPFRGDPSIPYKWDISQRIKDYADSFGHEIIILYFGDYDEKGLQIPQSALADIEKWCEAPFKFIRCGLSREQVEKYHVPENPDKPGEFQWEAVPDIAAKEIITSSLLPWIDEDKFSETKNREMEATEIFQEKIKEINFQIN
jgi:hypothetical protein